jgi:hypothetical protein
MDYFNNLSTVLTQAIGPGDNALKVQSLKSFETLQPC